MSTLLFTTTGLELTHGCLQIISLYLLFNINILSPIVSILVVEVTDLQMIFDVPIYIFTGMYFQEAVRQHSVTCLLDWRSSNL